ncbi:MAG: XdhC family protein [Kiloniellales bacterium]|nr:XdhC family protein [Kiloniellales bacterium]
MVLAAHWHGAGNKVAIATVIETWGSSPRSVGSQMIVDDSGRMEGSVSGGCIEAAVIEEAQDVMMEGSSKILEYGVSDERAWDLGLACGGRIRIYLERLV